MSWHFREKLPGEKVRNPIQGELFSDDAIDRPAQALVREAIQNSLDARSKDANPTSPVMVRMYLSGQDKALPADRAKVWFGGAWEHLLAPGNGLSDVPPVPQACPFLVVEDFETTGLEGDSTECDPPVRNSDNRFFAFFRAEGLSIKGGQQGGRWGVGKTVFPRSSRINASFGLTVRHGDHQQLLLGQTTLFYHSVGDKVYASDGYFGSLRKDGLVLPITDVSLFKQFERDFVLTRGDQPGLSVVIPYVDEKIVPDDIVQAVIQEYFQPILLGRLVVRVHSPGEATLQLSEKTLKEQMESFGTKLNHGLQNAVALAIWTRDEAEQHRVVLTDPGVPPTWSPKVLPADKAEQLAKDYQQGQTLALRVPVRVRQKDKPTRDSFFDVYLRRVGDGESYLPFYIRNGIIIPKVRDRQVRGHRMLALVLADDEGLAALLGDAEVPAHTHWSRHTQKFMQAGYTDGPEVLDFVSDAPRQLAELLSRQQQGKDEFLLADVFPRPEEQGASTTTSGGKTDPKKPSPKPVIPPPKPSPFCIDELVGGFGIRRNPAVPLGPTSCHVAVAYDTSRGNPLKRYESSGGLDFKLADLNIELQHGTTTTMGNNTLVCAVTDDMFHLQVTGFDPNRDLFVLVRGGDR